jgi:rhamnosyltransferase subunit B
MPTLPHSDTSPSQHPLVIVAASGTGGDILPFIRLSLGLLERGHRVLMLIPKYHDALVQASGIHYQTFGCNKTWETALKDPNLWDERKY